MNKAEFEAKLRRMLNDLDNACEASMELGCEAGEAGEDLRVLAFLIIAMKAAMAKGDLIEVADAVASKLDEIMKRQQKDSADKALRDLLDGIDGINLN
jgi:hypothetical protein